MNSLAGRTLMALMLLGMAACATPDAADSPEPESASATLALRRLSQHELDQYLEFIQSMRTQAGSAEAQLTSDPARLSEFLSGVAVQGRVAQMIEDTGFTQRQLAEIHYNMSMAYGALLVDENRVEIEAERIRQQHTIETMKDKVSKEQLDAMKRAMESSQSRVADAYAGVPAENKMLLRRNSEKMRATFQP